MKNNRITLLFILALFIGGCAKTPVYTAFWETKKADPDDVRITHYDINHKVRYTISNDSSNLYILFDTENKAVQRTILEEGAYIYIDTTGKKSEKIYAKYPAEAVQHGMGKERKEMSADNPMKRHRPISIPPTILWNNHGVSQTTNFMVEKSAFKGSITYDSLGYMIYKVTIPLLKICNRGVNINKPIGIGVKINSPSGSVQPSGGGGNMGQRGGGGMMGGAPNMGAGGSMMGGRGRRNMGTGSYMGDGFTNLNLWFSVTLSKESNLSNTW